MGLKSAGAVRAAGKIVLQFCPLRDFLDGLREEIAPSLKSGSLNQASFFTTSLPL
jgi:hypothetical protein